MADKAPKGTVKDILRFLSAYKIRLAASVFCSAVNAGLSLYIPLLFGQSIDLILGPGRVDFSSIKQKLILSAALIILSAAGAYVAAYENNKIISTLTRDIRNSAFKKLQVLPLSYLDNHPSGDTISRIINDVDRFSDGMLLGFTQFFSGIITIIGTLILLFIINWRVALTVLLLTPVSLIAARFIAGSSYKYFKNQAEINGKLTALTEEDIGSLKTLKAFSQEKREQEKFKKINLLLKGASLKAIFISSVTNPATRFVNALVYAAAALTGAFSVLGGTLSVGLLTSVLGYANQYTKPFNEISSVLAELQNSLSCAARVIELLNEKEEKPDAQNAVTIKKADGNIEIENIAFSYDKTKDFIKNFSLSVKKGQKVAIVGTTGCGKTTIINLLMRFYDVDSGRITLDGVDITDIKKSSLRENIGMVLQDTWLKNASVKENLLEGNKNATYEQMVSAAKRTHAHSFINRLAQKYDTVLGEDGGQISQGQKQLLCITRAMLSDPNILILDEATSSIDLATEIKVQRAFDELTKGRTCFIVAHRLSTVMNCDIIAVMDNGRIIESGTHKELLEKNGVYTKLWKS
ncbi:MAG: ABC transporter ATP-binding protein [Oscillospiraceae bacterium]|nr:ABC transporter ATP-binding protein [Oscillospiraceae bacterium]